MSPRGSAVGVFVSNCTTLSMRNMRHRPLLLWNSVETSARHCLMHEKKAMKLQTRFYG